MRVLLLGGTAEASALARRLYGDTRFDVTLSLAGRTSAPGVAAVPARSGGFGGAEGLARWIGEHRIDVLVDATHPFAVRISANAFAAAQASGVPLLSLRRAPWQRQPGDIWTCVGSAEEAARALGSAPARVFLTIGRQEVGAFRAAPQHAYVVRAIEAPAADALPPGAELILERGPFDLDAETALLRSRVIDVLVAKNSGAAATYAKIAAARALALPVVMIGQPGKAAGYVVGSVEEACARLAALLDHASVPSERGV